MELYKTGLFQQKLDRVDPLVIYPPHDSANVRLNQLICHYIIQVQIMSKFQRPSFNLFRRGGDLKIIGVD